MKFRKVPVVIDAFAIQEENISELQKWVESFGDVYADNFDFIDQEPDGTSLKVKTLEGTSYDVTINDVIIRGIKGEYYPCKKDIFQQTYELAYQHE